MQLYPAIDLRAGHCVRLHQGDFAQETVYSDDPVAMARHFESSGASWIHVVDLDAARRTGSNRELVQAIAESVAIPVQAGGGVRDASLLDVGVSRIVVGSLAVEDPDAVAALAVAYPDQIAVGLDHRSGIVQVRGWEEVGGPSVFELADRFSAAAAFVVTDISRDGTLAGPDVEGLAQLVARTPVPVIASGGVGRIEDLRALAGTGVAGVIVGKALYAGTITLEEAVTACAT